MTFSLKYESSTFRLSEACAAQKKQKLKHSKVKSMLSMLQQKTLINDHVATSQLSRHRQFAFAYQVVNHL
jgi:hypothetical protein